MLFYAHSSFEITSQFVRLVPRQRQDFPNNLNQTLPGSRREVEFSLKQAESRASVEQERANAVEEQLSRLREEMRQAEQGWKRSELYIL